MAGFGRISFEGEYYNQKIVNVLWYRSNEWLPGQGNPFDDVLAFVDGIISQCKVSYLDMFPDDYRLNEVKGIGYDDAFGIVTASPLVRTIAEQGTGASSAPTMGAAPSAIISLRCGEQHQISGVGTSRRNRGYLCVGPMTESNVDNYSHVTDGYRVYLDAFASNVQAAVNIIAPAVTLTPIRIHEKYISLLGVKTLVFRTYSDVLGYYSNRVMAYRHSRRPEA